MVESRVIAIRMPCECPVCQRTLYPTATSRPDVSSSYPAKLLFGIAGVVAAIVYGVLVVFLRYRLATRVESYDGLRVELYRMPPTLLVSAIALPLALVPGLGIGWIAGMLPRLRRLKCWNCHWSDTYPVEALWDTPRPLFPTPDTSSAMEIVSDDADPWGEATAWTYAEIRQGRTPEEVEADLLAGGWPRDDVQTMVERCRREARYGRAGVRAARNVRQ